MEMQKGHAYPQFQYQYDMDDFVKKEITQSAQNALATAEYDLPPEPGGSHVRKTAYRYTDYSEDARSIARLSVTHKRQRIEHTRPSTVLSTGSAAIAQSGGTGSHHGMVPSLNLAACFTPGNINGARLTPVHVSSAFSSGM